MMKMKLALPLLLLLATSVAFADTTYDNTSWVDNYLGPFGGEDSSGILLGIPTIGESFFAPSTDTILNSFSFFLNDGATGVLQAYVASWDEAEGAGTPTYVGSDTISITNTPVDQFTFVIPGGLSLTADDSYIIFITYSGLPNTASATVPYTDVSNPTASLGQLEFTFNPDPTQPWDSETDITAFQGDAWQFQADFTSSTPPATVTPEPGSLLLFGSGMIGLLGIARRRVTQAKASA